MAESPEEFTRVDDPGPLLIVIDRVQDMGGAEGSTTLLIRGAHDRGIRLGVVGLDNITLPDRRELEAEGVRFFSPARPGALSAIRCVLRAVREVRPKLIHSTLYRSDMAARMAGLVADVPVMTSIVNVPYGEQALTMAPSRFKLELYRRIESFLARHATFAFHSISQAATDAAVRSLGVDPAKVTIVPRGRSDETMGPRTQTRRDRARAELGLGADDLVAVNVAREDLQKAQWYLLDAVAAARDEPMRVQLVIAGRRGSASDRLDAEVAKLGIDDVVHRLGIRHDIPDLLCASDLFAFPSLYEGLGGALLEALALEVPIVAFDDPAVREAVGDAAVLVPMRDGDAFTAAFVGLLRDPARRATLAASGRARFLARFTNERYISGMVALYESEFAAVDSRPRGHLHALRRART